MTPPPLRARERIIALEPTKLATSVNEVIQMTWKMKISQRKTDYKTLTHEGCEAIGGGD